MQYHQDAPSFGGGAADTSMHPLVLVAMIVAIIALWLLPRRRMLSVFLCAAFLVPVGQELYLAGAHLYLLRIVILFTWIRLFWMKLSSREKIISGGFNSLDKVFVLWAVFRAVAFVIEHPAMGAVTNQLGFFCDVFGGYFLLRYLVRDEEDVRGAISTFSWIAAIVSVCMLNEKMRDLNIFGYFGGVQLVPSFREGAIRAQGPFSHAILAGCFGATLLPLFFWLWKDGNSKRLAGMGIVAATVITVMSASSTPLLAYVAVVMGVCFWPFRKQMRPLRWGIVIALVGLEIVMKAPVWFLINHVDLVGGNSSYHRAMLIDQFIRHFGDWWLHGTSAASTWGWDMWDTSNQFVAEGEAGGLLTFICFIAMISIAFGNIGRARKAAEGDRKKEWCMWLLGVTMFAHIVSFFGISYFDHMQVSWFALLAMISVLTLLPSEVTSPVPDAGPYPIPHLGVRRPITARATSEMRTYAPVPKGLSR